MSRNVTGPLHTPAGAVIVDTKVRFRSLRHNSSINGSSPIHSEAIIAINALGEFTTNLLEGDYEVHLQYGTSYQNLGVIVIDPAELGTVTLGELIDQYRDATGDYSASGLATQTWVQNYVGVGGSPADISLLAFKVNDGSTPLQQLRKKADNSGFEWFTLTPQDMQVQYETAVDNQLLQVGHNYKFTPGHTYTLPSAPAGKYIDYAWLGDPTNNPVTLNMNSKNFNGNTDATTLLDVNVSGRLIHTNTIYGWTV